VSNDPLLPTGDGHTLLTDDDRRGLLLTYITTRGELNEAEQANIVSALGRPSPTVEVLLDDFYLRELHKAMFSQVWSWAGRYRTLETNIGVDPIQIMTSVSDLVADAAMWITGSEPVDRVAVRFHQRLVSIHPFPNGNGRHARLATDLLLVAVGTEPFSWGAGFGATTEELRGQYFQALRRADADREDLDQLETFARS